MTASPPSGATSTPLPRSRALALLVLACTAMAAAIAAPATAAAPAPRPAGAVQACPAGGGAMRTREEIIGAERHVVCLVNRTRARFGLRPLSPNRCLHRVAARHAHDMVARRYFAHVTPNGWDTGARAQASGYAPRAAAWIVGENIAWGVDGAASPAWVMNAWMHSPGHRANILNPRFRDIGVGIVTDTPLPRFNRWPQRATFSVDFGAQDGRNQCDASLPRISRRRSSARVHRRRGARSAPSPSPR